ncbi:hypothetical protein ACQCT5_04720 [Sutcliffiella halmapala]
MTIKNKIKSMAKNNCAYFSHADNCILTESTCSYDNNKFLGHCRCVYFESSLLPSDKSLEENYWLEITETENVNPNSNIANCSRCSKEFVKNNNKHKYCDLCKEEMNRESSRKSMRKSRGEKMEVNVSFHNQIDISKVERENLKYFVKEAIPKIGGVYFLLKDGVVFYVGRSINLQNRLISHASKDGYLQSADEIALQYIDELSMQYVVEAVAIAEFMPELNRLGKTV